MPVAVACSCGASLRVPDAAAGKRVKCPKCGETLAVPAPEFEVIDDDEDDAPRPAARRTGVKSKPVEVDEPIDDDEDEEEDERPKKKTKGKGKGNKVKGKNREQEKKKRLITLIVGICGATFVLGAVGVVAAVVMNTEDPAKAGISTAPAAKPNLPSGWSLFKGGGFRVAVPDAAQFQEQQQPNVGGPRAVGNIKSYSNSVAPQPGQPAWLYSVGVISLTQKEVDEFNQNQAVAWEQMKQKLTAAGGKVDDEKPFTFAGVEGREWAVSVPAANLIGVARVIVKGDKAYTWTVLGRERVGVSDPNMKPFFDTFVID